LASGREFVNFLSEIRVGSCIVRAFGCRFVPSVGHEKTAKLAVFQSLSIGAGEGIRTLDPNLGKVVFTIDEN
jgi:hypothetical protein